MGIGFTVIIDKKMLRKHSIFLKQEGISAFEIGEIIEDKDTPIHLEG